MCHSNQSTEDDVNKIVWNTKVKIGTTEYRSNWAISNIRYEVLLGMPWHEHSQLEINYQTKEVKVKHKLLSKLDYGLTTKGREIGNIGIRKFRSIIRKEKGNAEVYMVHNIFCTNGKPQNSITHESNELNQVLEKYKSVIVNELPGDFHRSVT